MAPLLVFDNVMFPDKFSRRKDCFLKIILSLTLSQIYDTQALK